MDRTDRLKRLRLVDNYGITVFAFVLILLVASAVVTSVIITGTYFASSHSCDRKADAMGREHRYGLFEGCLVETDDGQFIPLENYRKFNEEKRG